MKFLGVLSYIAGFAVGLLLVLLPTIFTWSALFDSTIAGVLFSIFLFPIAILGYPIVILAAGLATGIGGTVSVLAAVLGYLMMGVALGLLFLGSWLFEKADEKKWARAQQQAEKEYLEAEHNKYLKEQAHNLEQWKKALIQQGMSPEEADEKIKQEMQSLQIKDKHPGS
jgi:polyferredoxin